MFHISLLITKYEITTPPSQFNSHGMIYLF
jgi:hypothetical protein